MRARGILLVVMVAIPGIASGRIVDRIAAIVETDVITQSEVDAFVRHQPKMAAMLKEADEPAEMLKKLRRQSLDQLIAERLLTAEIRKRNIKATALQIERAFELQIRANRTTRKRFLAVIRRSGLTEESYKRELARRLARQMLMERLFLPKIKVNEDDVRSYYNQNVNTIRDESVEYCVSHILRQTPAGMSEKDQEAQRKLAEKLLARLKKGADFATLAKQYSQDPSASRGGDLGCFRRGVMVPAFEEVVFKLSKGELSGVIKTKFGYHIAKVNDVKGSGVRPYKDVRRKIRMKLVQDQLERQVTRWVNERKKTAFVEKKL